MVFGFVRMGLAGIQAATRGAPTATKAAVKTLPNATPNSRLGWGGIAKTGIIGGSIGAAGLGISSAVGSAEQSIQTGGHGLLVLGAIAAGIILILLLLFRGRK